ncbi:glycosyltransferase family 2 protein [Labrys wisconsinensis]|uniref:Glycosyltransferase 2-like domain-containing protein n=1 Tax=Labrys wisconsinensis TaxID=425677 RepID=A0ABU0J6Q9_9HYPH|nr:glycosyltransferase family A protein [Labrys wisconsinensis]MDQ0469947.1 hypothetical protein [Labrys wisconsinensis]
MARLLLRRGRPLSALALAADDPLVLHRLGLWLRASQARDHRQSRAILARATAFAALGHIASADNLAGDALRRASAADARLFELARARWTPEEAVERLARLLPAAAAAAALAMADHASFLHDAERVLATAPDGVDEAALRAAAAVCRTDGAGQRAALDAMFAASGLRPVLAHDGPILTFAGLASEGPPAPRPTVRSRQPLVSVLMPAFDVEPYVAVAIRSVRAQTMADLELVVVDDASQDGTREAIERAAEDDARVIVIRHAVRRGTYAARATALRAASGHYVTVLDADDWAHPERLERHVDALGSRRATATVSRLIRMDRRGAPMSPRIYPIVRQNTSSLMVARATLEAVGGFPDLPFGGDQALLWTLHAAYGGIRRLPIIATIASHRAGSLTTGSETGTSSLAGLAGRVQQTEALLLPLARWGR